MGTIHVETGYDFAGFDRHAHMVHRGLVHEPQVIDDTTPNLPQFPPEAAFSSSTAEWWQSHDGGPVLKDNEDFGADTWVLTKSTIGDDGQTWSEGTDAGGPHYITQYFTHSSANGFVASFVVQPQTAPAIRIQVNDGVGNVSTATFDLHKKSVIQTTGPNAVGSEVHELPGGRLLLKLIISTLEPGSCFYRLIFYDTAVGEITFDGQGRTVRLLRAMMHPRQPNLQYEFASPVSCSVAVVAGHNCGSTGGGLRVQYDDNEDGTWTNATSAVYPADDAPVMLLFPAATSRLWRLNFVDAVEPRVSLWWLSPAPLVLPRPVYGGVTPPSVNLQADVLGNVSDGGELLGRSVRFRTRALSYQWQHLPYAWVRDNLDGPAGLIRSALAHPVFVAWRPGAADDVDLLMDPEIQPPQAMGTRDLWTFGLSGRAYGRE